MLIGRFPDTAWLGIQARTIKSLYMNTNNTNAVNGNRTNAIVTATITELHSSSIIAATMKSCTTNNDDDDDKRDDHHHPTILAAPEGAEIRHILASTVVVTF